MKKYKIIRKKSFSLVEMCIYITVLPIVIGLMSYLFVFSKTSSDSINYDTKVYSDISYFTNTLSNDINNAYSVEVDSDTILINNADGKKVYRFDSSNKTLSIDGYDALNIQDFDISEITTTDNVFPLYEISITTTLKDLKNNAYPYSFSSKFMVAERK